MDDTNSSVEAEGGPRSPMMGVSGLVSHRKSHERRENPGILRLDLGKPRRSSGSSVEFRSPPERLDLKISPPSPQPSVDRLSVTFAPEERSIFSDSGNIVNMFSPGSPPIISVDKTHYKDAEDDDEEDYSASVCAILQRRDTKRRQSKRRNRRPSSPFELDSGHSGFRRRSSVFTTSSGETAISMDEGVTQEQIYENLRLHKEVLSSVKQQPWGMRRKLRLVQQAKAYVKRHEGELQERLAQSKTTRDILASFNIILIKKWQYVKRELANFVNLLVPWELRIKEIESHFGSVVASYFTFLRWLFWVNLVISILLVAFVVVPELLTADPKTAGERKEMLPEEKANATNLMTLWDFEGALKYSPIFYGFYTNKDSKRTGYRLPFAYFMTGLAVYIYSFVATLKRMAENSRMSKLSEKEDECVFTWKLFTGWDYMIGNSETAHNRAASIILGFKEALLEEAEKKRNPRNWKIIGLRVLVNITVLALLAASAYAVIEVVKRSTEPERNDNWWRQNEITMVLTLITYIYPNIFEVLGYFECFHPRKQLRLQLARIMVLNMLNLYTLIFSLFGKINSLMENQLDGTLPISTELSNLNTVERIDPVFTTQTSADVKTILTTLAILTTHKISGFSPGKETSKAKPISLVKSNIPEISQEILTETNGEYPFQTNPSTLSSYVVFTDLSTDISSYSSSNTTENDTIQFPESYTTSIENSKNVSTFDTEISFSNVSSNTGININTESLENEIEEIGINSSREKYPNMLDPPVQSYVLDFDSQMYPDSSNVKLAASGEENNNYSSSNMNFSIDLTQETSSTVITEETENENFNDETELNIYTSDSELNFTTTEYKTDTLEDIVSTSVTDFQSDLNTDILQYFSSLSRTDILTTLIPLLSQNITENETDYGSENMPDISTINFIIEKLSTGTSTITEPTISPGIVSGYDSAETSVCPSESPSGDADLDMRRNRRRKCWETMFGQELVKLTVMDLIMTVINTLVLDFIRSIFVRFMNNCWCWDLEKQFPQYGDFKIAENILHLVNNQGMVWMGMFFSPGLPLLNLIKLVILMYLRSWAVLTCNVPHEIVFRASRSNNFYFALLLTMLFLCVLPVGYAIVWVQPSCHCGPFSGKRYIYRIFTESLQNALPTSFHKVLDYIASPGTVIPLLLLLILVIYYLLSLTSALREANNDLKIQLRRERTEERRKMFQLVHRRRRGGSGNDGADNPYNRWRKILPVLPSKTGISANDGTSIPADKEDSLLVGNGNVKNDANKNELLCRIMKRALRKSSATSDEESLPIVDGDGTDIELHESLPEDKPKVKYVKVKPNLDSNKNTVVETSADAGRPVKKSGNRRERNSHQHNHKRRSSEHRPKSSSISSAKEQEDSLKSVWSDNIPVICISKTDSFECIEKPDSQPSFSGNDDVTDIIEPVHKPSKSALTNVADSYAQNNKLDDPDSQRKLVQAILEESKLWKSKRENDDQNGIEMTLRDKKEKKSKGKVENEESEVTT